MQGESDELVAVELTEIEADMLHNGLFDWGGPGHCTEPLAQAMGFRDVTEFYDVAKRLADDLRHDRPMSRQNWTRALAATEIMFGCSMLVTNEWSVIDSVDDLRWYLTLESLRRKLPTSREYLPQGTILRGLRQTNDDV